MMMSKVAPATPSRIAPMTTDRMSLAGSAMPRKTTAAITSSRRTKPAAPLAEAADSGSRTLSTSGAQRNLKL